MSSSARKIALTLTAICFGVQFLGAVAAFAAAPAADAGASQLTALSGDVTKNLGQAGTGTGLIASDKDKGGDLPVIVGKIISAALALVGVVIVVFFIYAGFLWMTAQGNEEQVTKAKDILKNAVIGAVITFAAYAIAAFVVGKITGATLTPTPPAQTQNP